MKIIRASEIGSYLYCHRAWWYQGQGVEPANRHELAGGSRFHHRHGRQVILARLARMAGWLLLIIAFILLAAGLTLQWLAM